VVWNIFFFHNICDNHSHWLIFFKMISTTHQQWYYHYPRALPWFTDNSSIVIQGAAPVLFVKFIHNCVNYGLCNIYICIYINNNNNDDYSHNNNKNIYIYIYIYTYNSIYILIHSVHGLHKPTHITFGRAPAACRNMDPAQQLDQAELDMVGEKLMIFNASYGP